MRTALPPRDVRAYMLRNPDCASRDLHNMLLKDTPLMIRLRVLDQMFAESPPPGRGVYRHHDGYRS